MIKFFRNIRRQLLGEGITGKYFKYAIGEIVLVVIGILIALQINNWNENRLARIEEKTIKQNIHNEFLKNKKSLLSVLKLNQECFQSGLKIMSLIGKDKDELIQINTDSIIYRSVEFDLFSPSENALSDLFQSGRLQLIKDEKLKNLLYDWSRNLKLSLDNYEGFDSKIEVDLVPYLTRKIAMKDIDYYGPLNWKTKSILEIDKLVIFHEIEYENLMDDALYRLLTYIENLEMLNEIINDIIDITTI